MLLQKSDMLRYPTCLILVQVQFSMNFTKACALKYLFKHVIAHSLAHSYIFTHIKICNIHKQTSNFLLLHSFIKKNKGFQDFHLLVLNKRDFFRKVFLK